MSGLKIWNFFFHHNLMDLGLYFKVIMVSVRKYYYLLIKHAYFLAGWAWHMSVKMTYGSSHEHFHEKFLVRPQDDDIYYCHPFKFSFKFPFSIRL